MRCPYCGRMIAPRNSVSKKTADAILAELQRIPQPFRMDKVLRTRMAERFGVSLSSVEKAWNLLRGLDAVTKLEGQATHSLWRVKSL